MRSQIIRKFNQARMLVVPAPGQESSLQIICDRYIWLHAKTWVRKFGNRLSSFALVKWFFNFTIQSQNFDFLKLHKFGSFESTLN